MPVILRRLIQTGTAVLMLAALTSRPVAAEVRVGGLRLGLAPDVPVTQHRFPPGTQLIYAVFAYSGAADHEISAVVTGRSGLNLFESSQRYSGDGTDSFAISGTAITRALTDELLASARAARADAQRAATQAFGVQEYLLAIHSSLLRMGYAVDLLAGAELGPGGTGLLEETSTAVAEATELVRRAISVPTGEEPRKRALAGEMDAPLATAVQSTGELAQLAGRMTDLPIPESGADSRSAYTVQVQVAGFPAAAAEFVVASADPVYLPSCVQRRAGAF